MCIYFSRFFFKNSVFISTQQLNFCTFSAQALFLGFKTVPVLLEFLREFHSLPVWTENEQDLNSELLIQ
jgi:hypothetical protein